MSENKKEFSPVLAKANEAYLPLIEKQLVSNDIQFNEYARKCVLNAVGSINQMLSTEGLTWQSQELDQSNITQTLLNVAALELNSVAEPSECYFQLRNVKKKNGDKTEWKKVIEFGIQSDGYDAILSRFGRGVKKVYPFWEVRENDKFEYPSFNGLEMSPPKWTPSGKGKVIRIVYPILHEDNTIHFYISEREDVAKNLIAHINNNLMNECFGIAENRFKATDAQKEKINKKKKEIMNKARGLGLASLEDEELLQFISPAWKESFSSESMIVRKMRNNVTKKIPKDFGSSLTMECFEEMTNEGYSNAKQEIIENASTVVLEEIAPADEREEGNSPLLDETGANTHVDAENVIEAEFEAHDVENRQKPSFD